MLLKQGRVAIKHVWGQKERSLVELLMVRVHPVSVHGLVLILHLLTLFLELLFLLVARLALVFCVFLRKRWAS